MPTISPTTNLHPRSHTPHKHTNPHAHARTHTHTHTHARTHKHISNGDGRTGGKDVNNLWDEQLALKSREQIGILSEDLKDRKEFIACLMVDGSWFQAEVQMFWCGKMVFGKHTHTHTATSRHLAFLPQVRKKPAFTLKYLDWCQQYMYFAQPSF